MHGVKWLSGDKKPQFINSYNRQRYEENYDRQRDNGTRHIQKMQLVWLWGPLHNGGFLFHEKYLQGKS